MNLPQDTPLDCFHARRRDGGLGVPPFIITVPGMILGRLTAMSKSTSIAVRGAFNHLKVTAAVRWAERILTCVEPSVRITGRLVYIIPGIGGSCAKPQMCQQVVRG